jgi:hypothetical protein
MIRHLILAGLSASVSLLMQPVYAADADPATRSVRVECEFANGHSFPFTAGHDRCWDVINGKTLVPQGLVVCAHSWSDGRLSVTLRISELPKPECDTEEARDKIATREQIGIALPLLGPKERQFVSSHSHS